MDTLFRLLRTGLILPLLWLIVTLACNAPTGSDPLPESPATSTATPALAATVTISSTAVPTDSPEFSPATLPAIEIATLEPATPALLPTFTPIAQPTLAPTPAVVGTPTPTTPPRPANTPTPSGPLDFSYSISWRLSASNPFMAIASVTIQATGGSGVYTYYHDDIRRDGLTFEYNWAACQGNPGSLRVDSSDGQTVRKNYFESAPCPTPTPGS